MSVHQPLALKIELLEVASTSTTKFYETIKKNRFCWHCLSFLKMAILVILLDYYCAKPWWRSSKKEDQWNLIFLKKIVIYERARSWNLRIIPRINLQEFGTAANCVPFLFLKKSKYRSREGSNEVWLLEIGSSITQLTHLKYWGNIEETRSDLAQLPKCYFQKKEAVPAKLIFLIIS